MSVSPNHEGVDLAHLARKVMRSLIKDFHRPFSYQIFLLGFGICFLGTLVYRLSEPLSALFALTGFALIAWSTFSFWGWLQENSIVGLFTQKSFDRQNTSKIAPGDRRVYRYIIDRWDVAMDVIGASQTENVTESFAVRAAKSYWQGRKYNGTKSVTHRPRPARAYSDSFGVNFDLRTPAGWTYDRVARVMPELSELLGFRMQATSLRPGIVKITAVLRDPLDGTRAALTGGTGGTEVRIARAEDGGDIFLDFADPTHTIIQGSTRSGKSVLMYAVLAQLACAPNVQIWGSDPNSVLLGPLARTVSEEARAERFVIGLNTNQALEMLQRVTAVMDARISSLVPRRLEKISDFTAEEPVIVVVLEEYAALMAQALIEDKKAHAEIKRLVGRLFAEGAKAGIRVVMILQRAEAAIIDGSTRSNAMQRITLGVDNGDSVRMLHEGLDPETAEAVTHFRNGRFIINQHRENSIGQADYLEYSDYLAAMDKLTLDYED